MLKKLSLARTARLFGCLVFLSVLAPLPAAAGGVYFVKEGDTLAGIARLFSVDIAALRAANPLSGEEIAPGDGLRIPDAATHQSSAPAASGRHQANAERVLQAVCRDETVYHLVTKGETLNRIARRYSIELDEVLRLNGLRTTSKLAIGQKLVVRRSGPRSHTVRRGETLSRIAKGYGIAAAELARLNHLDGTRIAAGQQLLIVPCDPYATAGSAPPPLDLAGSAEREAGQLLAAFAAPAAAEATGDAGDAAPSVAAVAQRVIKLARTMLDIPYRFGGTTLRGIDCSAYVQRVFSLLEVRIPRTAREQYRVGASIGRDELAVGDLVFFRTYASFPSHVGIYLGDNLFIHASSMVRKVTIDSIDQPYYRKRFIGARRLVSDDASATLASAP